jgi:hypothetical protein
MPKYKRSEKEKQSLSLIVHVLTAKHHLEAVALKSI